MRAVPVSLFSLLIFAMCVGTGELLARLTGDEFLRWYISYFAIAFSIWTYVFYYDAGYRIQKRSHRLAYFVALSVFGFGLWMLLFPPRENPRVTAPMILVLSLPAIVELLLNRPILRRTPP